MSLVRMILLCGCVMIIGCSGQPSSATSCEPTKAEGCAATETCDAATKTCVASKPCGTDVDCGGFACSNSACKTSCDAGGVPANAACAVGYTCRDDRTCKAVDSCDPKKAPSSGDCNGGDCDASTKNCVIARKACANDGECANQFACIAASGVDRYCAASCRANSDCGGSSENYCDVATAQCKPILGSTCMPTDAAACGGFGSGYKCSAATQTCVLPMKCILSSDCPGAYACSSNAVTDKCYVNCSDNTQCKSGNTCNKTTGACQ